MKTAYRRTCWIVPEDEFKRDIYRYQDRVKEVWNDNGVLYYIVYRLFRPINHRGKKQYKTNRLPWRQKEQERGMESWYDHYPWRPENKTLGKEVKGEEKEAMALVHIGEHFKWLTIVCPDCNNRFDLMYDGGNNFSITCLNCKVGMRIKVKYRRR